MPTFNANYYTSDFISVFPTNNYCINRDVFSIATYTENKVFVRSLPHTNNIIPESNEAFIRFCAENDTLDIIQLEVNDHSSEYESFGWVLNSAKTTDTALTNGTVNLFNKDCKKPGYLAEGILRPLEDYYTTQFIRVYTDEYVTVMGLFGSIWVYDKLGNVVRNQPSIMAEGLTRATVKIASGEALIRFAYHIGNQDKIQIQKSIGYTEYRKPLIMDIDPERIKADNHKTTTIVVYPNSPFTSITSALNAITDNDYYNRYRIFVTPGTYEETFTVKNWVDIIGDNKHQCIINYTNPDETDFVNKSTIFAACNTTLENLTITTTGSKYPLHIDANYGLAYNLYIKNCIIHHNGFISGGEGTGIGIGLHYNQNVYIENSDISGSGGLGSAAIYCHNDDQNNTQYYSKLHRQISIISCLLHDSMYGVRLDSVETVDGQDNDCIYIGNENTCETLIFYNAGTFNSWHIFAPMNNPNV